jgi:tetratricopeptide (TPR) repeat protein
MDLQNNFQFSYQRLLSFLNRANEKGYAFARADDYRLIHHINQSLIVDLRQYGRKAKEIFLSQTVNSSLIAQIEDEAGQNNALIIANLYEIVNDEQTGLVSLSQLNFSREALWQIAKPILFWTDEKSMNIISNHAPDLFSQRRFTTIHFSGIETSSISDLMPKDGFENFLSSENFKAVQANIDILNKRLHDALAANYPITRIVTEIVLPLAKAYAKLNLTEKALKLLEEYSYIIDSDDVLMLSQKAEILRIMRMFIQSLECFESANRKIEFGDLKSRYWELWVTNNIQISEISLELGKPTNSLNILKDTLIYLNSREGDNNNESKYQMYRVKRALGRVFSTMGNLIEAKRMYSDCLKLCYEISNTKLSNKPIERDIVYTLNNLGFVSLVIGDLQNAKEFYERSLQIIFSSKIRNSDHLIAINYGRLASVYKQLGDINRATKYYKLNLEILEELYQRDPLSQVLRYNLSNSYYTLGNTYLKNEELPLAKEYFQKSVSILESYIEQEQNLTEKVELKVLRSYTGLGVVYYLSGDREKAKEMFERNEKVLNRLTRNNPHSREIYNALASTYHHLGVLHLSHDDINSARQYNEKCIDVLLKLHRKTPNSHNVLNNLAAAYEALAFTYTSLGELEKAEAAIKKAIEYSEQIGKDGIVTVNKRRDHAKCYSILGDILVRNKKEKEANESYKRSLEILESISTESIRSESDRTAIDSLKEKVEFLKI